MNDIQSAVEIFEKHGIKTRLNENNLIIISHYAQPKGTTFAELGINEDELIKNVVACEGLFDARKSQLTTFPLVVSQQITLYDDNNITEMPNLKAVGHFVVNKKLKKLPKLKAVGSMDLEESSIKSLPKLKDAGILIVQNSQVKDLSALETVGKLCIIDSPVQDLKNLKKAEDVFIYSSDAEKKIEIKALPELEEVSKLFVANSLLKSLPKLKKAQKLSFSNCQIKSVKASLKAEFEINDKITDEELSEKFDTFTDWYNSETFQQAMNILGGVVNKIQS